MRRRRPRKIVKPPQFEGYRPYGHKDRQLEDVELLYEEYESLKLADYKFLTHLEASQLMDVSRATFSRIYESARRKIAKALVEGRGLKTVFGNVEFHEDWYVCNDCKARFTLGKHIGNPECAMCKSEDIKSFKII